MKRLSKVLAIVFLVLIFFGANAWAGEVITGKFEVRPGWSPSPEEQLVTIGVTIVGPIGIFPSGIPLETFNQVIISGPPPEPEPGAGFETIYQEFRSFAENLNCTVGNPVPSDFMPDQTAVSFVCQGRWHNLPVKAAALLEFPLTFVPPTTSP